MSDTNKVWYVHREKEKKTYGPFSLEELKALINQKRVGGLDKVSKKGETYQSAYSVPELSSLFVQTSGTTPVTHDKQGTDRTPVPPVKAEVSMAPPSRKPVIREGFLRTYRKQIVLSGIVAGIAVLLVFVFTRVPVQEFLKNLFEKKPEKVEVAETPVTGTPGEHLERARSLMRSGALENFPEAEREYNIALKFPDTYEPALLGLAELYYSWARLEGAPERFEGAIKHAEAVLEVNPGSADAFTLLAFAFNEINRPEEARTNAESAYSIRQDDWRITFLLAGLYQRDPGGRARSEEFFERTVKLKPDHIEAHRQLAVMYEEDKRFADSVVHYEKLAALEPSNYNYQYSLGVNYTRIERIKNAVESYKRCLFLAPEHLDARINLSRLLFDRVEDYDAAMENIEFLLSRYLEQLSEYDRKFFSVALGRIYLIKELYDDAIRQFQAVLNSAPDNIDAHFYLGDAYFAKDMLHEAEKEYRQVLRLNPDSAAVHLSLARVMDKLGRRDLAIDELKIVLGTDPTFAEAHYMLGTYKDKDGYYYEAMEYYRNAIKHKQDYPEAHYALGQDALKLGDTKQAIESFRAVKSINPSYGDVLYFLAEAYFAEGNVKSALKEYREYIRKNPAGKYKTEAESRVRHYR